MASQANADDTKAVFFPNYPTPDLVSQLMRHSTYKYAGELIRPAEVKGFLQYYVVNEKKPQPSSYVTKYKSESQVRGWVLLLENDKQRDLALSAVKHLHQHGVVDVVYWPRQAIKAYIHYDNLPR
jgi:hypothetical protein